jgi:uncharacterized protein YndB with AHSA1/START domain
VTEPRTVVITRVYPVSPHDVWEMWTTTEGIEAWWGPDGFSVEVHALDVSVGGALDYSMKADGDDQIAYLRSVGMPTATRHSMVFTEVDPPKTLAYLHMVDFVPGMDAYQVETRVELAPEGEGTRLTLTLDAMHDQHWTDLAVAGWEQELDRLTVALAGKERS